MFSLFDRRSYLFVDESGEPGTASPDDKHGQYLCLVGVAIRHGDYVSHVKPGFEELKSRHFPRHASIPVTLHRSDIVRRKGPFAVLSDPARAEAFDADLLALYRDLPYAVIGVVIDKIAHDRHARRFHDDAYNWALALLLERYCGRLKIERRRGMIVIESRAKHLDRQLQRGYDRVYERGTTHQRHPASFFQEFLQSKSIQFRQKSPAVAGLELADGLVKTAKAAILADHGKTPRISSTFGCAVERALEGKWNRWVARNRVDGYGKVFFTLPDMK
ncbi:MAG: DUF3800 domain-containing protein [Gemmatimonadales bacterium]